MMAHRLRHLLLGSLVLCGGFETGELAAAMRLATPTSASASYGIARIILGASEPLTVDDLSKALASAGISRSGESWSRSDGDGTVEVVADFENRLFTILYRPAKRSPMPSGLLASVTSAASHCELAGPDEVVFTFKGKPSTGGTGRPTTWDEYITVSLLDGAWVGTSSLIGFK